MAALTSTLVARQTIMLVPGPRRIGPDPVLEARGVSAASVRVQARSRPCG
jgi:hypothetical protein